MQSSKAMKRVEKEIEAAAVALGFPRRVSPERVEREAVVVQRKNTTRALLKPSRERDRFLALTNLFLLMDQARELPDELLERGKLVRKLVGKVAA